MLSALLTSKIVNRLMELVVEMYCEDRPEMAKQHWPSPPARCAQCGSEPFVVKWGAVRVGQDLCGYFYQATSGPEPELLCRDCWHRVLGIDDPLTGTRTNHAARNVAGGSFGE